MDNNFNSNVTREQPAMTVYERTGAIDARNDGIRRLLNEGRASAFTVYSANGAELQQNHICGSDDILYRVNPQFRHDSALQGSEYKQSLSSTRQSSKETTSTSETQVSRLSNARGEDALLTTVTGTVTDSSGKTLLATNETCRTADDKTTCSGTTTPNTPNTHQLEVLQEGPTSTLVVKDGSKMIGTVILNQGGTGAVEVRINVPNSSAICK